MAEKKLFLLDAYALIYRAFYAMMRTPRITGGGLNTSAVFGFCLALEDVLRKENPGYIAVCFDPEHGRTFRHEEYPEYKAGRDRQPEDITVAIPYIKAILKALRIPVIEVPGYEADDVIGTLSRKAEAGGFVTYMMTPDKDYGQLVTDRVFQYRPAIKGNGFEVRGPEQICERYGIQSPRQVIDLLALEGDKADNIPGCPGVGEKTAAKLILEFGSVDNLLANTDRLKGALKANVENNADQIRMSKHLVTIATDVPVGFDPAELRREEPDRPALLEIFKELEFRSLIQKYGLSEAAAAPSVPAPSPAAPAPNATPSLFDFDNAAPDAAPAGTMTAADWESVELTEGAAVDAFIGRCLGAHNVGIAIAATGAEAMTAAATGIALARRPDTADGGFEAAYIPFPADTEARKVLMEKLSPLFADASLTLCGADIKRYMLILGRMNVEFDGAGYFDTAVAHYLCQPEQKHDLTNLAMTYLGYEAGTHAGEPASDTAEKAVLALRLMPILEAEVAEKGMEKLLNDVELPLVRVLASMEREGVRIDTAELKELSRQLSERLKELETKAYQTAGHPFNVSSPAQVGAILFDEMAIDPKARKTKGGSWSTAEDVLEKYAKDVPLVQLILDIRGLKKLLATYVDALPKLINPRTGKIHTTYNQTVTATGRISSSNPNLQNIPIRSDDGRDIRRAFIPDPGCLMLSADYSQIELRLMADFSGDSSMIEAFVSGDDIHRATAAKIYHIPLADVSDSQRRNAKTANFGIIYGISAFGLSERLSIPRAEAKELIEGYLHTYPKVEEYMRTSVERAQQDGFVTTVMGRRRYLPDINSRSNTVRSYAERNAVNAPIQGSAADIIKLAMVRIDAEIRSRGLRSRMILQVHDELVFNVVPDEAETLEALVVKDMVEAYRGRVPMEVAAGIGRNWLEAH